jgi:hypothetical protein
MDPPVGRCDAVRVNGFGESLAEGRRPRPAWSAAGFNQPQTYVDQSSLIPDTGGGRLPDTRPSGRIQTCPQSPQEYTGEGVVFSQNGNSAVSRA